VVTPLSGDREPPRASTLVVEDDAEGAGALPDRHGKPKTSDAKVGAMLALAALVLVGIAVVVVEPPRTLIGQPPNAPSPTSSRNDSGTPLPSEAEAWGRIWSQADGAPVPLRPTWLPKNQGDYQIQSGVGPSANGSFQYNVSYWELHSVPGTTVWHIDFLAEPLGGPSRGLQQFGGAAQELKIRGHVGELFGNGSPGWTLVWNEGNYRYAIQAFGVSREDFLQITDSLVPVIDGTGQTTPPT
jgi:hypothetical protein